MQSVAALRLLVAPTSRARHFLRSSRRCLSTASASVAAPEPSADKGAAAGKAKGGKEKGQKGGKQQKPVECTSSAADIKVLRLQKVQEMRQAGKNPFEYRFDRTNVAGELQFKHTELADGEELPGKESVAGRVMARRVFGKLAFLSLQDDSGSIQLYCDKARMGDEAFDAVKSSLDVGDIIGVTGPLKRTEKGELSVVVEEVKILTKSLLPLPDKFHGLKDVETRYRQRYVDMLTRPEVRETFRARSRIISMIRRSLEDKGFLEIETPVLQTEAGGAEARPFVTYHNSLTRSLTLRIATELHLKRLIVGGFERVFELGRVFRNEGISTRHNPEFTSVEIYQAYADRSDMIELTEEIVCNAARAVRDAEAVDYQGTLISFQRPWRRASMNDLVREACGLDILSMSADLSAAKEAAVAFLSSDAINFDQLKVDKQAVRAGIPDARAAGTIGHLLNALFETLVEKTLIQPTFVLDHPLDISPLAKPHRSVPGVAERFELFVYGRELANAFSELTDPVDQRERLEAQIAVHRGMQEAAASRAAAEGSDSAREAAEELKYDIRMDEDFVTALEYGMPPSAGLGIGVDRLVMLLTDSPSIRDVIAFPVMKDAAA